jgi:hypothetical protein
MRMSFNPTVVADRQEAKPEEEARLAATASADSTKSVVAQAWAAIALEDFLVEPSKDSMTESA